MNRGIFKVRLEAELEQLNFKIEALIEDIEESYDDIGEDMGRQVERLQTKKAEFEEKIEELADPDIEEWERIKDDVRASWKDLKATFDETIAKHQ